MNQTNTKPQFTIVTPVVPIKQLEGRYPVTVITPTGLVTRYLYEYTLYCASVEYPVTDVFYAGESHEGTATIVTYGISYKRVWFEGDHRRESDCRDLGIISAQMWQVSALLSDLFATRFTIDLMHMGTETPILMPDAVIDDLVNRATARMNKQAGKWGNPFGKAAERDFIKNLKAEDTSSKLTFNRNENLGGVMSSGN